MFSGESRHGAVYMTLSQGQDGNVVVVCLCCIDSIRQATAVTFTFIESSTYFCGQ
jgi:hypothetical protein